MASKNKPLAYILWLFTGVFGGHRFYLGSKAIGALYLILLMSLGHFAGEGLDNIADLAGASIFLLWLYDSYWIATSNQNADKALEQHQSKSAVTTSQPPNSLAERLTDLESVEGDGISSASSRRRRPFKVGQRNGPQKEETNSASEPQVVKSSGYDGLSSALDELRKKKD